MPLSAAPPATTWIVAVFAAVYGGMMLGRIPRLKLDRTGIALLGAIALVASGAVAVDAAVAAVDVPTIALLFALMVVSAQLRLGGFYARAARSIANLPVTPPALLAALVGVVGALSAVFTNDVVCLAVTPVILAACLRRGLAPVPFLLAVACASNVGSAATLIGNPQNILIGQTLDLSFAGYLLDGGIPATLGLGAVWAVIAMQSRGRWTLEDRTGSATAEASDEPAFDGWQTTKGLLVAGTILLAFLATDLPREAIALAGAGVVLASRRMHSRATLGLVDWPLLVLFVGLFVVHHALASTGLPARAMATLAGAGVDPARPAWLFAGAVVLSNAVSNVPAVLLLLPAATHPAAGPVLALASTLAGNLLLVGSIANILVVEESARAGVAISWRRHAATGVPVTLATLAIAAAWLAVRIAWAG